MSLCGGVLRRLRSEPLYLHFSGLSNPRQLAASARLYGVFYGELKDYLETHSEVYPVIGEVSESIDKDLLELATNSLTDILVVRQSNSVMLREVSALRAFLSIIEASRGDEDTLHDLGLAEMTERYRTFGEFITVLADQTDTWQSQLAIEKASRARHHLASEPGWTWTPAAQRRLEYARDCLYSLTDQSEDDWELVDALIPHPILTLRSVVATVLNAFPPLLEWNLSGMGQRPGSD